MKFVLSQQLLSLFWLGILVGESVSTVDQALLLTLALLSCEGSILGSDATLEEHYITPLHETWNGPSDERCFQRRVCGK